MPFYIAFIDDTDMLRISVSNLLGQMQPQYKVYQYCHGKDLLERLPHQDYKPDLFIMDISMPYINGYDATIWAKKHFPDTPVLAFTMLNNDTALLKMYNCGANGFVTKNSQPDTLLEAIEEVSKGNFYCNINTDYKIVKNVLYKNNQIIQPSKPLTEHEAQVLRLLTTELSYKQMAQQLGVGQRTVETHKHNISIKLDIHTREGLMLYAIKAGLVML
jgi:two-component system, NarL family, invasion response regulator UvrY